MRPNRPRLLPLAALLLLLAGAALTLRPAASCAPLVAHVHLHGGHIVSQDTSGGCPHA